ncbi:MAG: ABC transporter substrate-binding protein [Candidatus Korobacteraceae bacterium]|jgi:branched-chain amino acid transport system substrate-binding protein
MNPEEDSPGNEAVVEHSTRSTRREFVKTAAVTAASLAAGSLISCGTTSNAARTVKIGYVASKTGPLSPFAEADEFVLSGVRKLLVDGIAINGIMHTVVIIEKDSRSDPNRAAEVTSHLIKADKVDLLISSGAPETVNPVAEQAEANQVPCITNDAPWQGYFFGRGGKPGVGFEWTYHFFWGMEDIVAVCTNLWQMLPTNKVVGALWPNDTDGTAFADASTGFPSTLKKLGFTLVDTGRLAPTTNDFLGQISAFKKAGVEIVTGTLTPPAFSTFWSQAAQQRLKPKITTVAKALLFPTSVESLGGRGLNLSTEVWWSPYHPFRSGLTGQSCLEFCAEFESRTGKQWTQPLGMKHSLFEVAIDVLRRTKDIDSRQAVLEAIRSTDYHSIVGPINWIKSPYGNPVKNVCKTPLVGGQWVKGSKYKYDLLVVNNATAPEIPTQAGLLPLP